MRGEAIGAVVLGVVMCAPAPEEVNSRMATPATLTATFQATDQALEIRYTLTNTGREPLFVINVAVRVSPQGTTVEVGRPRVELTRDRQLLLLSRLPPWDRSVSYAAPPAAYATHLPVGQTERITIEMPLPLVPENLPPPRDKEDVRELLVQRVSFLLGVLPASAAPRAAEQEIAGVKLWRLPVFEALPHQIELKAEAALPGVRVLAPR